MQAPSTGREKLAVLMENDLRQRFLWRRFDESIRAFVVKQLISSMPDWLVNFILVMESTS